MSMTIDGAYNILSDPAITESSELPIAVKALIALALADQRKDKNDCALFLEALESYERTGSIPGYLAYCVAQARSERKPKEPESKGKPYHESDCYCRSNEICDRCHWAKGSRCRKGCTCGRNFPFNQGERIRRKDGGQQGVVVGTGVRRDGDSYASHLIVGEWEPV